MDTLDRLDRLIQSRSILNHPFYVAWKCGKLTRQQLRTYAQNYYPHVAAFPEYLRSAIASTYNPTVRKELELNLLDEIGNPAPHHELWLDFAEALGLHRNEVRLSKPAKTTANVVGTFSAITRSGSAEALAALYAYESQQPEVSKEKIAGLKEHYEISDPRAVAYFSVHATADVRHRAGERAALARAIAGGASPEAILGAAEKALDAYWKLLDGIWETEKTRSDES